MYHSSDVGVRYLISVRCQLAAILLSPENNSPLERLYGSVLQSIDRAKWSVQPGKSPIPIAHIIRDRQLSKSILAKTDYRPRVSSIGRPLHCVYQLSTKTPFFGQRNVNAHEIG